MSDRYNKFYLMDKVKDQPCRNIRVRITSGNISTDKYVVIEACDARLTGVKSIVPVNKLRGERKTAVWKN